MNNFPLSCLLLTLCAVANPNEVAGQTCQFTGFGRVFYEPDAFDLSFAVVTEDQDVKTGQRRHAEAVAGVERFLQQHRARISSLDQQVAQLERVQAPNRSTPIVYRFATGFTARVVEAASLSDLQVGLVENGVTDLRGLDMFSKELPTLMEQARRLAIKDAKAKAELAATELGWRIKGAINVAFQENAYPQAASTQFGSRAHAYQEAARPERTTHFDSTVSVTFEFEPAK